MTKEHGQSRVEDLERLAALLADPDAAIALLPESEQQRYREAQESVIEARRYAQRHAHEIWIG